MTQEVRKLHIVEELLINLERTGEEELLTKVTQEVKDAYFCTAKLIDILYILVSIKKNHGENSEYQDMILRIKESAETNEAYKSIEKIVVLIIRLNIYVCATQCSFSINR